MTSATEWLKPGMRVITSDGEELGRVKEVAPLSFKVNARMSPDYWLPLDSVVQRELEEAVTRFARDELSENIVEPPDIPLV